MKAWLIISLYILLLHALYVALCFGVRWVCM